MDCPQGRILSLHYDTEPASAVVEVTAALRCARCAAGRGCGAGIQDGQSKPRQVRARLAPGLQVREGDEVEIALASNDILRASLIVYGLPLAGAGLGAGAAYLAGAGDLVAATAALGGLCAGVLAARGRLQRAGCLQRFSPTVTSRADGTG